MLEKVNLEKKLKDEHEYNSELRKWQLRMLKAERALTESPYSLIVAYEGWDASGKGGSIKRITEKLDPRGYEVHAIAAPSPDEKNAHYLRRFWLRLPRRGRMGIFDRTWYGRVLVERVEGFATEKEWKRAYREINEFERTLVENGTILAKFWMHISKEEQYARFKEREESPYKRWKITSEDWRNREKWDDYVAAAEEMLAKTSRDYAPWHIIEGNYKWFARVKTLRAVVKAVEARIGRPQDDPELGEHA